MRKLLLTLTVLGSSTLALGQELIPNDSFENASGCPVGPGELELADPWILPSVGTADYFNSCNTTPDSVGTPTNAVGSQVPFHGEAYAGLIALSPARSVPDYREYVQTSILGGALDAGKTYRFSMELSLAEDSSAATDRIGAHFSSTAISSSDYFVLPFTPQLETPAGTFLDDTIEWMNFDETFVAVGDEAFVTIGNFHDFTTSASTPAGSGPAPPLQLGTAYYYLDKVSLQCEPCLAPPTDMTGWWTLDESGGIIAYDVVNAQHGAKLGGPTTIAGLVDNGLAFSAGGVSVPTSPWLEHDTADFSLDAWVRPDALGVPMAIFAKIHPVDPLTGPGYALVMNADGTLTFIMVDASLASATGVTTEALQAGVWSHVTVAVDRDVATGGRIHIDGSVATFDPTTAPGSLSNALPLRFAQDGGAGVGGDFTGGLDEVEVFHRALSQAEALALYQSRTSGKCKTLLEVVPVTGVPITTTGVLTTTGTLTNGSDSPGTFAVAVRGEPAGTRCGLRRSNVDGPLNPVVLSPQPIQLGPGESAEVRFELDIPRNLTPGWFACYSVTMVHLESGNRFVSRGGLRGARQRSAQPR